MDGNYPIKRVREFIADSIHYLQNFNGNHSATLRRTKLEKQFTEYIGKLDDPIYWRWIISKFVKELRTLQDLSTQAGYRAGVVFISDYISQKNPDGSNSFLVGVMFPINCIQSSAFTHYGFSEYENVEDIFDSSLEALVHASGASVVYPYVQYNFNNSHDYQFVTFYFGPRIQPDTDEAFPALELDQQVLESINLQLQEAFRVTPVSIFSNPNNYLEA